MTDHGLQYKKMVPDKPKPTYLGDGVYVEFDGFHVVLKTGNHLTPDNTVYLEHSVREALLEYIASVKAYAKACTGV